MSELTNHLRIAVADEFVFSLQAQSHHWNVRGMLFKELHDFFGEIYSGAYGTVDVFAEYIRIEGEMAPASVADIYKNKSVTELHIVPGTSVEMIQNLIDVNAQTVVTLKSLLEVAKSANNEAIVNYVASVLDMHGKWDWMLKAHLEK